MSIFFDKILTAFMDNFAERTETDLFEWRN